MNHAPPTYRARPLRLWPGVLLVTLQWFGRFVLPAWFPGALEFGVFGSLFLGLGIVLWWVLLSRAPWAERLGAIALMVLASVGTYSLLHESIASSMGGRTFVLYLVPALSLTLVVWAVATRTLRGGLRWGTLVAAILLPCLVFTLLRTDGMTGAVDSQFSWRWSKTAEDRLLAEAGDAKGAGAGEIAIDPEAEAPWPGFRGAGRDGVVRDGVVRGSRIATDWQTSPPLELWRRPVGPGWSSFAVQGAAGGVQLIYTQEQRGEEEVVSCYRLSTGEPVWRHRDAVRFWESIGGAGPRATPTLSGGRVYAFGATGLLNALDAGSGALLWSRDVQADTGVEVPEWGFASSPLVLDEVVMVAAAGTLAAYDLATGERRWLGPDGKRGYSSPQLVTLAGVPQVLLLSQTGAVSYGVTRGELLWEYPWETTVRIVQPGLTAEGDLLISEGDSRGVRRLAVRPGPGAEAEGGWSFEERWTSHRLKPYFNDFVVHEGHAYGFDGSILAAIDMEDGERDWKGGRYGNGQLLLLAEQDLLLVLSEQGELALVRASPEGFEELGRIPVLAGKTWNHPVLVDDVLLVRNAEEMAALRLN